MGKFCTNCGKELNEKQDICLGCGSMIKKQENLSSINNPINHYGYMNTVGIIMIILGTLLILGANYEMYEYPILVFNLPGLFSIVSGILILNAKKNKNLLLTSAIILFIGAVSNILGIQDISIYTVVVVIFGVMNIVYYKEK